MSLRMRYDEFNRKLQDVKGEFRAVSGKELETVQELEAFLKRQTDVAEGPRPRRMRPTLKSLRGLGF